MKFLLSLVLDNKLCSKNKNILDLQHCKILINRIKKHNAFGNNFMCLIDGNDILLEVVNDHPPKSLT